MSGAVFKAGRDNIELVARDKANEGPDGGNGGEDDNDNGNGGNGGSGGGRTGNFVGSTTNNVNYVRPQVASHSSARFNKHAGKRHLNHAGPENPMVNVCCPYCNEHFLILKAYFA